MKIGWFSRWLISKLPGAKIIKIERYRASVRLECTRNPERDFQWDTPRMFNSRHEAEGWLEYIRTDKGLLKSVSGKFVYGHAWPVKMEKVVFCEFRDETL
jgi:hypothetical protein